MEIQTLRGNFSQFSKGLSIRVSDGNATLDTYIDHKELRAFAAMLVDVADDALYKIGEEAQNCQSKLRDCLEDLQSGEWKASLIEPVPEQEDVHYAWELHDAEGEWQAGGSAYSLDDVKREGNRYLQTYSQHGPHKLIIERHCVTTIEPVPKREAEQ